MEVGGTWMSSLWGHRFALLWVGGSPSLFEWTDLKPHALFIIVRVDRPTLLSTPVLSPLPVPFRLPAPSLDPCHFVSPSSDPCHFVSPSSDPCHFVSPSSDPYVTTSLDPCHCSARVLDPCHFSYLAPIASPPPVHIWGLKRDACPGHQRLVQPTTLMHTWQQTHTLGSRHTHIHTHTWQHTHTYTHTLGSRQHPPLCGWTSVSHPIHPMWLRGSTAVWSPHHGPPHHVFFTCKRAHTLPDNCTHLVLL